MSHVTRTPLSRSKGQGHQAALLTAVLARQAAAAVGVRTCWPLETAATLPSARRRKALGRPLGEEWSGAYRGGRPPTVCYFRLSWEWDSKEVADGFCFSYWPYRNNSITVKCVFIFSFL